VFGMAMAYDVLYAEFRGSDRELLRSTIARVVRGRRSWGMGLQETLLASNWVLYNSNLWLANLAIEGSSADKDIETQFPIAIKGFLKMSIYPSGESLEDGMCSVLSMRAS
jgi:hypothetical protein